MSNKLSGSTAMAGALHRWSSIRDPVRVCGLAFLLLLLAGCGTTGHLTAPTAEDAAPFADGAIQVGDVVKVTFPGAANLNFTQQVRVDGILSLDQSRQILVVDKTSQQVKEELLTLFGPELIIKEVNVMVESAGFPIYVSGAVLRPGKVVANRSMSVLEGIMEAGGYDSNRANLKKVQVIRQEKGGQKNLVIDLDEVLRNPSSRAFHLRPKDSVIVPERLLF